MNIKSIFLEKYKWAIGGRVGRRDFALMYLVYIFSLLLYAYLFFPRVELVSVFSSEIRSTTTEDCALFFLFLAASPLLPGRDFLYCTISCPPGIFHDASFVPLSIVLGVILFFVTILANIIFFIKRLHDLNVSGCWCIILFFSTFLLGFACPILFLFFSCMLFVIFLLCVLPGTKGDNKYGRKPI